MTQMRHGLTLNGASLLCHGEGQWFKIVRVLTLQLRGTKNLYLVQSFIASGVLNQGHLAKTEVTSKNGPVGIQVKMDTQYPLLVLRGD